MSKKNAALDAKIMRCLENHTIMTYVQVAHEMGIPDPETNDPAEKQKKQKAYELKIYKRLRELCDEKVVKHQKVGYSINREWKQNQPKAYVFIITNYPQPKVRGAQYQKKLVKEIKDGFKNGMHHGVTLTSAEIVMGHDYDTILIIYANNVNQIGEFVLNYLQPHELVSKTHTVMVWPCEYEHPVHPGNDSEPSEFPELAEE